MVPKTYNGEKTASSTNVAGKTGYLPCLSPCTSINSNWIKDLHIRPESLKMVRERAGNTLEPIGIGNNLLSRIQLAQQPRERIDN
jgi:hypothetical protein